MFGSSWNILDLKEVLDLGDTENPKTLNPKPGVRVLGDFWLGTDAGGQGVPKVSKMRSPDERPKNDLGVILGEWNRKWKLLFRVQGLGFRDDVGFWVQGPMLLEQRPPTKATTFERPPPQGLLFPQGFQCVSTTLSKPNMRRRMRPFQSTVATGRGLLNPI